MAESDSKWIERPTDVSLWGEHAKTRAYAGIVEVQARELEWIRIRVRYYRDVKGGHIVGKDTPQFGGMFDQYDYDRAIDHYRNKAVIFFMTGHHEIGE